MPTKQIKALEQMLIDHYSSNHNKERHVLMPGVDHADLFSKHTEVFKDTACPTCKGNCCLHCAKEEGYLYELPSSIVAEYKRLFDFSPIAGFKGENSCNIPWAYRSLTCNSFYCGSGVSYKVENPKFSYKLMNRIEQLKDNYVSKLEPIVFYRKPQI